MPRIATKLASDLAIRKLRPMADQNGYVSHAVAGGPPGLLIQLGPNGSKSWILRITTGQKPHPTIPGKMVQIRRNLGLGSYPSVSLQAAREKAAAYRRQVSDGIDPKANKRDVQRAAMEARAKLKTFSECERETVAAKGKGYKNPLKSITEWRTRMDLHVNPTLGKRFIAELTSDDIAGVLSPLWHSKFPTAKKLLNDIAAVFRYAKAKKLRDGENPATREALAPLLGKTSHKKRHFPSLPYPRIAEFMTDLRDHDIDSARALTFAILTAARSDEVRSAEWSEFDLENHLWTIPARRMKREREHVVPLSKQAVRLLMVQRENGFGYPFANLKGTPLTDMALSNLVKRMHASSVKREDIGYLDPKYGEIAVPHGFRSTFKDWARNLTSFADEVSELALAHVNSDATRAAYARDQLLGPRKKLMQDWADYCSCNTDALTAAGT